MLSAVQKSKICYFLGYPLIESYQALALGFPSANQLRFVLNYALQAIMPEAEPEVLRVLDECICVEAQISDARSRLQTIAVDKIKMNNMELAQLEDTLDYWVDRLADTLGVVRNPTSHQGRRGGITLIEPEDL